MVQDMTDNDLIKGIREIVREELHPIKETLDEHSKILRGHTATLEGIADQLTDVSEDVTEIKDKLESQEARITIIERGAGLTPTTD